MSNNSTSDFPSLGSSNSNLDKSSEGINGEKSWADIAQEVPPASEAGQSEVDHRPNAWESTKGQASYADVAEHNTAQDEEFPTPQQATEKLEEEGKLEKAPESQGVSDLLDAKQGSHESVEESAQPPNPDRSYASAADNRDFPALSEKDKDQDAPESSDLSDLPDVKDMLQESSVKIPPPPASQSFAKTAAKTPPAEPQAEPVKPQPKEDKPDFPSIQEAKDTSTPVSNDLSDIPDAHEMLKEKSVKDVSPERSFADITKENLEDAPPSATAKPLDSHPVYTEEELLKEETRREARKYVHGGSDANVAPEMERAIEVAEEEVIDEIKGESALMRHIDYFDRKNRGKITLFDTFVSLRGLGYNILITLPTTLLIHLRLSPLTSPYSLPFIYRSITDLITLPIYTKVLPKILAYTPLLISGKPAKTLEEVLSTFGRRVKVSQLGLQKGIDGLSESAAESRQQDAKMEEARGPQDMISVQGLAFWDGLRAMHAVGKEKGLAWTATHWAVNKVQWIATYSMLHDPATGLVTRTILKELYSA